MTRDFFLSEPLVESLPLRRVTAKYSREGEIEMKTAQGKTCQRDEAIGEQEGRGSDNSQWHVSCASLMIPVRMLKSVLFLLPVHVFLAGSLCLSCWGGRVGLFL